MTRRAARTGALVTALLLAAAVPAAAVEADETGSGDPAVHVADTSDYRAGADGDLWPSCWGADGDLYTAWGDGRGFGDKGTDIGAARLRGGPDRLTGTNLALGDQLGQVWSGEGFTRKPTGMACVGGKKYLAVQDLAHDFNQAPAATIASSTDGKKWSWNKKKPMFEDGVFTTIMFLDRGQEGHNTPDGYVYAYGIDGNWRDSFSDVVPDPVDLYLARVPADQVMNRSAWEFYRGAPGGTPAYTKDIRAKKPVLHDDRRTAAGMSVISQGSVTYYPPLKRYIYSSWTEYTFEFYSAPTPWGPFTRTNSVDFGAYPWSTKRYGGYGLTMPSKFIGSRGRSAWLQSNVCPCAPAGMSNYDYSLRPVDISGAPTPAGRHE